MHNSRGHLLEGKVLSRRRASNAEKACWNSITLCNIHMGSFQTSSKTEKSNGGKPKVVALIAEAPA